MSNSKQGEDLYRPIIKEGTHLAPSKKTPGAYRGTQLSDANNQVDGQTEWVKVEESEYDYSYDSPYDYEESSEAVELTEEQREMAAIIGAAAAIIALVAAAAPRVKNWWQAKVAPSIKKTWQGISRKKNMPIKKKLHVCTTKLAATSGSVPGLFSQELNDAYENYVNDMTNEEAQRELLDIFILSAVVATKIMKLAHSRIVKDDMASPEYIEGKEVIEKLSTPQFVNSINRILESTPNLLEEKSASLSAILGRTLVVDGRYLPIENEALRAVFTSEM